jgi:Na+/H+ antiporter NhaD/arsenite permease-like protein
MLTLIPILFVIGYLAIAFEHPLHINKTATALITGVLCWTLYALSGTVDPHHILEQLGHHLESVSEILFFLLGAMTIVELVDAHHGFNIITDRINTRNSVVLMWIVAFVSFFLSAALDNLTTSIVMVSLLRKLLPKGQKRLLMASVVIIAANAGGAWSPIGDVTTTMLWIGGQISASHIITGIFIPSLVSLLIPLGIFSYQLRNDKDLPAIPHSTHATPDGSKIMFFLGIGSLLFVPIFKTVTHLPPYMGVLLGLSIVWIASELIHKDKDEEAKKPFTAGFALSKIDSSSILFFLGILMAIGSLESLGMLETLAKWMDQKIGNMEIIVTAIGLASSIIDNVPLVAASMGMYSLEVYPMDHKLWEMMAFCAGTGGSILIIGSAAGVAVMGMEKIDFIWYLKRISLVTLIGYLAGTITYLLLV